MTPPKWTFWTELDRQATIANHLDITPHESEIQWDLTPDRLFETVSTSPHWWAYEAALQQLEREYFAAQRAEAQQKRAKAQQGAQGRVLAFARAGKSTKK